MGKNLLFFFFICIICNDINAQVQFPPPHEEAEDALFKYWTFQRKMEENYMIAQGDANIEGSGIPASILNKCSYYIKWGDATIDLGWYLATLATEYKLLNLVGEKTDTTIKKIFQELTTINRLDAHAEKIENPSQFQDDMLEGYFIRDDVYNYVGNHDLIHVRNGNEYWYASDKKQIIDSSDHTKGQESQDQIIHLLMGLKCVKDFVHDTVTFNNTPFAFDIADGPITPFVEESKRITNRLVYYMRNRLEWVNNSTAHHWNWVIFDNAFPLERVIPKQEPIWLAPGFDGTQEQIIDQGTFNVPPFDFNCHVRWFFSNIAWTFLSNFIINGTEETKPQMLEAMSNTWFGHNRQMAAVELFERNFSMGCQYEHLPLLYALGFQAPCIIPPYHYWKMIREDPMYLGAWNLSWVSDCKDFTSDNTFGSFEWSSTSRFVHPERMGRCVGEFSGSFNNLDYMLLYNLFYLYYWDYLPPYLNGYNPHISNLVNFPYHGYGTTSEPYTVNGIENIYAVNTIDDNTNVTYRAGETIELNPGFTTVSGSNFEAYISPFVMDSPWPLCDPPRLSNRNLNNTSYEDIDTKENNFTNLNTNPNPFSNTVTINYNFECKSIKIELYDLLGHSIEYLENRELQNEKYSNSFNLEKLAPGIYLLKTIIDDNYVINSKIIKQ